jgi:hypothetical protein
MAQSSKPGVDGLSGERKRLRGWEHDEEGSPTGGTVPMPFKVYCLAEDISDVGLGDISDGG